MTTVGRYVAAIGTGLLLSSCVQNHVEREVRTPAEFRAVGRAGLSTLKSKSPFLKAHMAGGNVYVLHRWDVPAGDSLITGEGVLFNEFRDTIGRGSFTIGIDSIALIESNVLTSSGAAVALTVLTGVTLLVAAVCLANPKACFGSCPTFYASDGDSLRLAAEGFSGSIAPSLEAGDVDALFHLEPAGGRAEIVMKNEAYETHVVRRADLVAVPRKPGARIFATADGRFLEGAGERMPTRASGPEGDCLPALAAIDGVERLSAADSADLAAREIIELEFDAEPGREYGLVVSCRQSLLTTYLLYQMYAWMGNDAGRWLADIERGRLDRGRQSAEDLIGGIEAEVRGPNGDWLPAGRIEEHGPLAVDTHILPVPAGAGAPSSVRLRLAKGTWRIDYAALTEITGTPGPARIPPSSVLNGGVEDADALAALLDDRRTLVTLPGDEYTLRYDLPDGGGPFEFFLESRGYYLEWIRQEWIEEEDQARLLELLAAPGPALRRVAPEFKKAEPGMEECFWGSRYAKP